MNFCIYTCILVIIMTETNEYSVNKFYGEYDKLNPNTQIRLDNFIGSIVEVGQNIVGAIF